MSNKVETKKSMLRKHERHESILEDSLGAVKMSGLNNGMSKVSETQTRDV